MRVAGLFDARRTRGIADADGGCGADHAGALTADRPRPMPQHVDAFGRHRHPAPPRARAEPHHKRADVDGTKTPEGPHRPLIRATGALTSHPAMDVPHMAASTMERLRRFIWTALPRIAATSKGSPGAHASGRSNPRGAPTGEASPTGHASDTIDDFQRGGGMVQPPRLERGTSRSTI